MGRLAGKIAIVTGGASGIGAASVGVFAAEGAKVLSLDVQEELGAEVAKAVQAKGGDAVFLKCDVSRSADVGRAVSEAEKRFGGVDVLFANAAIQLGKTVTDTTEAEWDRLMAVNLKGPFLCCQAAIPAMQKRGGGAIVITSSVNGFRAEPELAAYCSSKGGLIMLVKSIAVDYGRDRIRANAICPGWVDTPINEPYFRTPGNREFGNSLQPRGRIGDPEEIGKVAAFLASDDASFMTGAAVTVDGGVMSVLNGHRFVY